MHDNKKVPFEDEQGLSRTKQKDLLRWDISTITWTLFFVGILNKETRLLVKNTRKVRNRVFHARGTIATLDEIYKIIKLSYQLHDQVKLEG